MTKIFNFALKIKGMVGRVAHAKSSDPATPPKKNLERAPAERAKNATSFRGKKLKCHFQGHTTLQTQKR